MFLIPMTNSKKWQKPFVLNLFFGAFDCDFFITAHWVKTHVPCWLEIELEKSV